VTTVWATSARPQQALPFDPCPGRVDEVRALAVRLREGADRLQDVTARVRWQPRLWRDDAARAAGERLAELQQGVRLLRQSFEDAAAALDGWAARLSGLQREADTLDREAAEVERRLADLDVAVIGAGHVGAGLDLGTAARRDALHEQLRQVVARATALHQEYAAASHEHAGRLDAAGRLAPGEESAADRRWAEVHDRAEDVWRLGVRTAAPAADVVARGAGWVSTAAGGVALFRPAAAVATPVAAATAGLALQHRVVLALAADGSWQAVADSAVGVGLSLAAPAVTVAAPALAVRRGSAGARAADGTDDVAEVVAVRTTTAGTALEVGAALSRQEPAPQRGSVRTAAGGSSSITAHVVDEPWEVGHGLRGTAFAAVATVPVPVDRLRPPRTDRSGERDDQDRVRRRGL
jgi:hypothetical protein